MSAGDTEAQIVAAEAFLSELCLREPAMAGWRHIQTLRARHTRAVFQIEADGRELIAKFYFDPDTIARLPQIWARQRDLHATMAPQNSIAEPVAFLPQHGALINQYIPGVDYTLAMRYADHDRALALSHRAGNWLRALTKDRLQQKPIFHRTLLQRTRRSINRISDEAEVSLALKAYARLEQMSQNFRRVRAEFGAIHGDFAPMNLVLSDEGGTFGIDVESSAEMFVMIDIAKFLVLQNHYQPIDEDQFFGLSAPLLDSFLSGWGGLSDEERHLVLPFFIGRALIQHVAARGQDSETKAARMAALERFVAARQT